MQIQDLTDLDEVLRIIDQSGLCRANDRTPVEGCARSIANQILSRKEGLKNASARNHGQGSKVLPSGN